MQVNKTKEEADALMKEWGFEPFPHTDYDCLECGIHVTVRDERPVTWSQAKKLKEVDDVEIL